MEGKGGEGRIRKGSEVRGGEKGRKGSKGSVEEGMGSGGEGREGKGSEGMGWDRIGGWMEERETGRKEGVWGLLKGGLERWR